MSIIATDKQFKNKHTRSLALPYYLSFRIKARRVEGGGIPTIPYRRLPRFDVKAVHLPAGERPLRWNSTHMTVGSGVATETKGVFNTPLPSVHVAQHVRHARPATPPKYKSPHTTQYNQRNASYLFNSAYISVNLSLPRRAQMSISNPSHALLSIVCIIPSAPRAASTSFFFRELTDATNNLP